MTETKLLATQENASGFYPTPKELAEKMLAWIDWDYVKTILEPSAGKGDLVRAVACAWYTNGRGRKLDIDCIEIDPHLRGVLDYTLCGKRLQEINKRLGELGEKAHYSKDLRQKVDGLTEKERSELEALEREKNSMPGSGVRVVHDDFLTYNGYKHYDLIVMNPPFADGDKHLLKALELQKHGGEIVCLLNAETIRNPYTQTRKRLMDELNRREAKVTFLSNAFSDAERRTDVEIALVRVSVPKEQEKSDIYETMHQAKQEKIESGEVTDLVGGDWLDQVLTAYQVEVEATLRLIQTYENMRPYMRRGFGGERFEESPILTLTIGTGRNVMQDCDVNEYMRVVRLKYWEELIARREFTGGLTSKLQEKYRVMVNDLAEYDFTRFNIRKVMLELNAEMADGIKETIMQLFDKLSGVHAHYDGGQNVHYYNGWKTNKAHKVNKKVIVPCYGIVGEYSWSKVFDKHKAYGLLSDLEKSFNYLDGGMTEDVDLDLVLDAALDEGQRSKIVCKYFDVDFFKKGTVHIRFTDLELLDRLNIYAARGRNWLPPGYGKKAYHDLDVEEKAVVDSFQGEAAYNDVLARAAYYLSDPVNAMPALEAGV